LFLKDRAGREIAPFLCQTLILVSNAPPTIFSYFQRILILASCAPLHYIENNDRQPKKHCQALFQELLQKPRSVQREPETKTPELARV
jgi:hypothetical protein